MSEEILDDKVIETGIPDSSNYASAGQRFITYLIDIVIYYVIVIISGMLFASLGNSVGSSIGLLVSISSFFLYYVLMEYQTGQTVGKMIMKTRVVTKHGDDISLSQAFTRTISRLVPIEFLSIWIGDGVMWHDSFASTRVIKA